MKEPSWLKEVQPYSCLDCKDLLEIFNYKNKSAFENDIDKGLFPPPDKKQNYGVKSKRMWYVTTIRKVIKKVNAGEANGQKVLSIVSVNETNRENEVDTDKKV